MRAIHAAFGPVDDHCRGVELLLLVEVGGVALVRPEVRICEALRAANVRYAPAVFPVPCLGRHCVLANV